MRKLVLMVAVSACGGSSKPTTPVASASAPAEQAPPEKTQASTDGQAFAALAGTGDITSGFDDADIYGGLTGGSVGTIGHGSGTGSGGFRVGGRQPGPQASVGSPTTKGDLDKAIIRRYVKRNLPEITACYEQELLTQPALAGAVRVEFMIGADGKVSKSAGTGLAKVDACVAAVIQKIEFPKPLGGGSVAVTYPFTFRPAGS